jgi:hypothetical protein
LHGVHAGHSFLERVTQEAGSPQETDPIREGKGCGMDDGFELGVLLGCHHELGVNRHQLVGRGTLDQALDDGQRLEHVHVANPDA